MSETPADFAIEVVGLMRRFQGVGHCRLHRHIDVLSNTRHVAMPQGDQRAGDPVEGRQVFPLLPARRDWGTIRFPTEIQQAPHGQPTMSGAR